MRFDFMISWWNKMIDKALAKHGKIDLMIETSWQIDLAKKRGIEIPESDITRDKDGYRISPAKIFTLAV